MKIILNLIVKEYILFFKDKVALTLTFIVPVVLIFIFGQVFGGGGSDVRKIHLGFINKSNAPVAQKLEKTLDTSKAFVLIKKTKNESGEMVLFDTNSLKKNIKSGNISSGLVIPENAYTDTSSGLRLIYYFDPKNDIETQFVQGMLQQIIMQQVPELFNQGMQVQSEKYLGKEKGNEFNRDIAKSVGKYFNIDTSEILSRDLNKKNETEKNSGGFNFFENIVNIEKVQLVGKDIANPMATRSVGGWAMMFLLFTITGASSSLFDEKKNGVMLRILSSPVSRTQILWSKYLYNMSLGIIQLTVLFITGALLFNIDILSNVFNLLIVVISASAACTGFGMLLSSFSKTSAQANGYGTVFILTMSAIGGAWFPVSFMPAIIQFFSKFTIVYWAVEGFLAVLWRGADFGGIWQYAAVLLGMALVINIISIWNFRKGNVF